MRRPTASHFDPRRRRVNLELPDLLYDRSKLEAIFLPTGQMLQLDRVLHLHGNKLVAEFNVRNHWVFPMHFPSDPIFPGSLLIEAAGQAVAVWAWHAGLRGKPRMLRVAAKFKHPVLPGDDKVALYAEVQQRRNICLGTVELSSRGRTVAEVRPMILVLPD
jgi:3-hydroxymyristoyl/3-hydroxydecanoyl-(acyl carrier protein) dehydratase